MSKTQIHFVTLESPLQDTAIILKRDSERLAGEKATLDGQVQRLEQVMQRLTLATSAQESSGLQDLQSSYEDLRSNFPEEYVMYNLAAIALTQVVPYLICHLDLLYLCIKSVATKDG